MRNVKRGGFTLIELLIVIAIILILVAIALPNFLEAQVRARVANAKGSLRSIETAFHEHLVDWGCIPADFNDTSESIKNCRTHGTYISGPCSPRPDLNFQTDGGLEFIVDRDRYYANNMHCPLTTPIAYLPFDTTFDVFSDGTVPIGYGSREIKGKMIFGVFFSAGPDRIAGDWAFNAPYNIDVNGDGCRESLPYSPTNGTNSRGEFWGVVGDWNYLYDPGELPCGSAQREHGIQRTY